MSRIAEDRGKVSDFEKAGYVQLSPSRKSLKILLDDPAQAFQYTYYVSVADIHKALEQPSFAAQIVKRIDRESEG
jgi:hypothetical protein